VEAQIGFRIFNPYANSAIVASTIKCQTKYMSLDQVANFIKVVVALGHGVSDTSIDLATGQGAKLPDPASGQYNLVWWNATDYADPADDPNVEIVRVTARLNDTITVTRAQEGTTATQKQNVGKIYKMQLALTAKMIADIASSSGGSVGLKFISVTGIIPGTSFTAAQAFTGKSVIIQNNTFFYQDVDYTVSGTDITWLYTLPAPFTSPLTLLCVG
jgi:hypothetical protein